MTINPIRRALDRARQQGRAEGIAVAVAHLREAAALHHGQVGDGRRRSALNTAADDLRDGREPSRTPPPRRQDR